MCPAGGGDPNDKDYLAAEARARVSLTVPLPELAEQSRIVAEVERQLSIADAMVAAIDSALGEERATPPVDSRSCVPRNARATGSERRAGVGPA